MKYNVFVARAIELESTLETLASEMKQVIVLDTWDGWETWDRAYAKAKILRQTAQDEHANDFYRTLPTRKQAVDEIIQEENSEQELARLKEEVEIKQRLTELLDVCEMQQKEITRLKNENSVMRDWIRTAKATVMHAVENLSQATGMTHRDKDERILGVISTMMSVANRMVMRHKSNMDDIPF